MAEQDIFVTPNAGAHNSDLEAAIKRLEKGKQYTDLSTICVIPTRGVIPAKVVESWWGLMAPMNNKFIRIFMQAYEVGDAYNQAVDLILAHEELRQWKYLLTLEEDNTPPPDGLLKLYESIDQFDAVGGLYWTKGEGGQPMIYGDPKGVLAFQPQIPRVGEVQECNGLGMGFTLFKLDLFRDGRIEKPFFKTVQEWSPQTGGAVGTQDLYFFGKARTAGYRVACDTRVLVGHYDHKTGRVW